MGNRYLLFVSLLLFSFVGRAQPTFEFTGKKKLAVTQTTFYIDSTFQAVPGVVESMIQQGHGFSGVLDLDYGRYPVWVRLEVQNHGKTNKLMAIFENPLIDSIDFYSPTDSVKPGLHNYLGDGYQSRIFKGTFQKFPLDVPVGSSAVFYFRIRNTEQLILPIAVAEETEAFQTNNLRDLIYGAFIGVVLVMLLYNLFVYAATRDKNYLYYVLYILFIGLGQISMSGHMFSLLIGDFPGLYKVCIVVLPAFSGIFAVLFIQQFLQAQNVEPLLNKILFGVAGFYGIIAIVRILGLDHMSARMMDVVGLPAAAVVFILAFKVYAKGFKSAIYFILAWSVFIIGVVMFVMRNLSILPFNWITSYTLPMGAALEVSLLSFALADKINTLQEQKREKEKEALMAALENEKLIREQNVILEQKVEERTHELSISNTNLSTALHDLKSTQSQLVDQEKMASLGQLTAGIAHEINNPINFVTSNINPLKRDIGMIQELVNNLEQIALESDDSSEKQKKIEEWKQEIDYDYLQEEMAFLLRGIDEGAHRTAEIVKGLRVFARQDEDAILQADVIEGIESTIVILNNQLGKIEIIREFKGPMVIDCYPGKLNQVFLNLISNAIFAIHEKFGQENGGKITIGLREEVDHIFLTFEDNGCGMEEEVQKKVFEPFFTTKPVGQGTGLGMSIVFKTIETHKGKISVKSIPGQGTTFEIELKRKLINLE